VTPGNETLLQESVVPLLGPLVDLEGETKTAETGETVGAVATLSQDFQFDPHARSAKATKLLPKRAEVLELGRNQRVAVRRQPTDG
jgi:hypothetical protein